MGGRKSDYFESGEGVASGSLLSHWVIALALTTEQPFPGCFWRRADAMADSAQLPSLGLAAISWHQSSHGWGQEFPLHPLSSPVLLPKTGWCQHLPEPSEPGKPSTFPLETTKCAVVSGLCSLILSLLPLGHLLGTVSLVLPEPGGQRGSVGSYQAGPLNEWREKSLPFQLFMSYAVSISLSGFLLLSLSGAKTRTMVLIKLFKGKERKGREIFLANAPCRFKELPIKVLNTVTNDCIWAQAAQAMVWICTQLQLFSSFMGDWATDYAAKLESLHLNELVNRLWK